MIGSDYNHPCASGPCRCTPAQKSQAYLVRAKLKADRLGCQNSDAASSTFSARIFSQPVCTANLKFQIAFLLVRGLFDYIRASFVKLLYQLNKHPLYKDYKI